MCRLCFSITLVALAVMLKHNLRADDQPPFYLGGRANDDLPALTDDELGAPQQQALLTTLAGDPYGHRECDHWRAGYAMDIRRHAIPSNTRYYGGYLVGGGLPFKSDAPALDEGTYGWDYFGILFNKRIDLNWSHGRRYQGGTARYRTDGPRLMHR